MITELREWARSSTRQLIAEGSSLQGVSAVDKLSQQPARIRQQRTLAVTIAAVALLTVYILLTAIAHLPGLVELHDHRRCMLLLVGMAFTGLGLLLNTRNRPTEGMWIICFGILSVYAVLQYLSQMGIRSPGSYVLLMLIPLSGFVGGLRNMHPVFAGVLSAIVLTYLAERTGILTGQSGANVPFLEATLVTQLAVAFSLYMLTRVTGESLDLLSDLPHESNRIISHELRQPLSTVVAAVLVLSHPQLSDKMRARTLKSLTNATQTMMGLLDDIADHGKLASGDTELTIAPFAPAVLIHEVFGMYEGAALQKGVSARCRVDIDDNTVVMGDASRLTQILSNLMSNAVKYTEHGEVTLAVSSKPSADLPDTLKVRFTIMDTGIGIPKDRQRQIFQAFTKGDEERFNQPGMGLGLSIAKHLVAAMKGTIGFESTRGRGSLFWVEVNLPLTGSSSQLGSTGKPEGFIPLPLNKPRSV